MDIVKVIMAGFLMGFISALPVGSSALEIARRGVCYGFWAAFLVGLGTLTSDIIYATLAYLGVSKIILENAAIKDISGGIAAAILAGLGVYILLETRKIYNQDMQKYEKDEFQPYFTGLLMTIFNPFVLVFWAGVFALTLRSPLIAEIGSLEILFLVFAMAGILTWTVVLSYLASLGKINFNSKIRKIASSVVGVILILSSLAIIYKLIFTQTKIF